ncbi:hypothetical protein MMC20_001111 [Loxospora ochrophaea]|nr:hypothetical protein [Loxospora ochrophaea]
MSKPIIEVIGSLNVDFITLTSRLPSPGETLTSTSFTTAPGGKGANQAIACSRLSRASVTPQDGEVEVRMTGAVGDDAFGEKVIKVLKRDGVKVDGITKIKEVATGVANIIVEEKTGENRILLHPGANHSLQPADFLDLPEPRPDLIVLQLEIPLPVIAQIVDLAQRYKIKVLFNPAPAVEGIPQEVWQGIQSLIVNESEASLLGGKFASGGGADEIELTKDSMKEIASHFHELGVETIVITQGSRGAFWHRRGEGAGQIPAEEVKVIDTTGAGDTFTGAYAVELAKWIQKSRRRSSEEAFDLSAAVKAATKAAARAVERRGALEAIPWKNEVL